MAPGDETQQSKRRVAFFGRQGELFKKGEMKQNDDTEFSGQNSNDDGVYRY